LIGNMKKIKILFVLAFLAGSAILSSCLKDDIGEYWTDDLKGKMYATVSEATFHSLGLKPIADPVTFEFALNIATDAVPSSDITLTLAADEAAVTKYNTNFKKAYKLFPNIEVLNSTVVIKAGSRIGTVKVKVWGADAFDPCDNYMAAISIKSATGGVLLTSNMSTYIMALPISNAQEGSYKVTGFFKHPTASSSRAIDMTKPLSTVDCKTVHGDLADLGPDYTLDFAVTSETITVDGKTVNKVIVTGYGAQVTEQIDNGPSIVKLADNSIAFGSDGVFNYYDPSTKTFVVRYHYNNGAAWREAQETWVRQ